VSFCIHCGTSNPDKAVFCLGCGQTLFREPKLGRRRNALLALSAFLLISAIFVAALWIENANRSSPAKVPTNPQLVESKTAEPKTDSVLMIIAIDRKGSTIGQGSGFVLSSDGLAGSNYHVLEGAARAIASSPDGQTFDLGLIEGADLKKDLVVFQLYPQGSKAKPHDLPHVTLGSSQDLVVGERVIAIGSPQGLENSVSDGILSAIREVDSVRYLQITAPISPGSSGGPVLDSAGQMIGVATFQFKKGQNLNFAVAADHIKPLLDQHFQLSLNEFQSIVGHAQPGQRKDATSEAAQIVTMSTTLRPGGMRIRFDKGVNENTQAELLKVLEEAVIEEALKDPNFSIQFSSDDGYLITYEERYKGKVTNSSKTVMTPMQFEREIQENW
jgi:S1-C subfamily serine protease